MANPCPIIVLFCSTFATALPIFLSAIGFSNPKEMENSPTQFLSQSELIVSTTTNKIFGAVLSMTFAHPPTLSHSCLAAVALHFAELYWTSVNQRLFDVTVEGQTRPNIDIISKAGGKNVAFKLDFLGLVISDGYLDIEIKDVFPKIDQGKLSAIEIHLLGPHLAHAVAGGPVSATNRSSISILATFFLY